MPQKKFLCAALFAILLVCDVSAKDPFKEDPFKSKIDRFRLEMIKLWEDHIMYTRNFIISAIANLPDKDAVTQRLLSNQDDIGDAFKSYFGKQVGNKLTDLLREHILIAADVVADAISHDMQKFALDYEAWENNARDIAKFLRKINSRWSRKELQKMLFKHLELTTEEASSRLQMDWESDIAAYDENHIHMLIFADILTKGIQDKFPNKF